MYRLGLGLGLGTGNAFYSFFCFKKWRIPLSCPPGLAWAWAEVWRYTMPLVAMWCKCDVMRLSLTCAPRRMRCLVPKVPPSFSQSWERGGWWTQRCAWSQHMPGLHRIQVVDRIKIMLSRKELEVPDEWTALVSLSNTDIIYFRLPCHCRVYSNPLT